MKLVSAKVNRGLIFSCVQPFCERSFKEGSHMTMHLFTTSLMFVCRAIHGTPTRIGCCITRKYQIRPKILAREKHSSLSASVTNKKVFINYYNLVPYNLRYLNLMNTFSNSDYSSDAIPSK
jgi:hypothetical protein